MYAGGLALNVRSSDHYRVTAPTSLHSLPFRLNEAFPIYAALFIRRGRGCRGLCLFPFN